MRLKETSMPPALAPTASACSSTAVSSSASTCESLGEDLVFDENHPWIRLYENVYSIARLRDHFTRDGGVSSDSLLPACNMDRVQLWERCAPILVQLSVCLEARLREAHLARLREGGELARLVARQGELRGTEEDMRRMSREHPELPDDLLNFHYDPLACAVASGWDGAQVEELELRTCTEEGVLSFPEEPGGRRTRVVTEVDGPCLEEEWLRAVASVGSDA
jgi:hypothetical protein